MYVPLNETEAESLKGIAFDELVQVDREKFRGNAKMVAEIKVVRHTDQVVLRLRVLKAISYQRQIILGTCNALDTMAYSRLKTSGSNDLPICSGCPKS